jgi:hypothetical protein
VSAAVIPVVCGLVVGITLLVVVSIIFTPISTMNGKDTNCGESIQKVKERVKAKESFALLLPTKVPSGYSLQSVDYVPGVYVTMQYFTKSLCDPNNSPYSPDEGVLQIGEGSLSGHLADAATKTGQQYVKEEMAKYQASNINATSYTFQDGRMHAVGYWDRTYLKAALWIVDDKTKTIVTVQARSLETPLEQLVVIGESLKEL